MKRIRKWLGLTFSFWMGLGSLMPVLAASPFEDVAPEDDWYEEIAFCAQNNIMSGMSDGLFHPKDSLTRGALVTILWRMKGEPDATSNSFSDVPDWSYYAQSASWARSKGILQGNEHADGSRTFDGDDPITRQDLALIFARYSALLDDHTVVYSPSVYNKYPDGDEVGSWAYEPVAWALGETYLNAINGKIQPELPADRASVAGFITRYVKDGPECLLEHYIGGSTGMWQISEPATNQSLGSRDYICSECGTLIDSQILPAGSQSQQEYLVELEGGEMTSLNGYHFSPVADLLLDMINSERAGQGLNPLVLDESLNTISDIRSEEIAVLFDYDHMRPNGLEWNSLYDEDLDKYTIGENIARTPAGKNTREIAEDLMGFWMENEGHRSNILNPDFTRIGIGYFCSDEQTSTILPGQYYIGFGVLNFGVKNSD